MREGADVIDDLPAFEGSQFLLERGHRPASFRSDPIQIAIRAAVHFRGVAEIRRLRPEFAGAVALAIAF